MAWRRNLVLRKGERATAREKGRNRFFELLDRDEIHVRSFV